MVVGERRHISGADILVEGYTGWSSSCRSKKMIPLSSKQGDGGPKANPLLLPSIIQDYESLPSQEGVKSGQESPGTCWKYCKTKSRDSTSKTLRGSIPLKMMLCPVKRHFQQGFLVCIKTNSMTKEKADKKTG